MLPSKSSHLQTRTWQSQVDMEIFNLGLVELVMTFGGVLVFAWWQFRDLKKYKTGEKTDQKDRERWKSEKD